MPREVDADKTDAEQDHGQFKGRKPMGRQAGDVSSSPDQVRGLVRGGGSSVDFGGGCTGIERGRGEIDGLYHARRSRNVRADVLRVVAESRGYEVQSDEHAEHGCGRNTEPQDERSPPQRYQVHSSQPVNH